MRLAAANLVAATDTLLFDCPDGQQAFITLNLVNRSGGLAKVRVAFTASDTAPTDADWIEFDTPLPAAGASGGSTLERTGLSLQAKDRIYVRSDVAGVSAVAYGLQETV